MNVKLYWFPESGLSLYVGGLYVGSVSRHIPEDWRDWPWLQKMEADGKPSMREYYERHEKTPWRAWLFTDEDGEQIGMFATEEDAKAALKAAALKELEH